MAEFWKWNGNFQELDKKGALYPMVSSPREVKVYDAF